MPLDVSPLTDREAAVALVRRLFAEYGLAYWRRYAVALVLMAIAAACTALSAYLIGEVVNQAYVARNYAAIVTLCGIVFAVFALKGFATYGQAVILARIANAIAAAAQRRVFAKLLGERLEFFADRHSSEFAVRLGVGAGATGQVLNLLVSGVGRDFLTLLGLVAVMVYHDPIMSFVGLIVAPPAIFLLRKLVRRTQTVAQSQFVGGMRVFETLQETIQGIRTVKAFTLEDEIRQRADANIREVEFAANKMARVANRSSPLMETLGGFAIAIAILYAGYRILETGAEPGGFMAFVTAFLLAYEPAKRLARLNIDLSAALVGVRALYEVIDGPELEPSSDTGAPLQLSRARVELHHVNFSYRPGEPVLRDLTFTAEPGKMTALVGPSGGGKSTVLNLILRFYAPDKGRIVIDGQDIATVSRSSLRGQIAYVGQDVFLFRGTIRDNIRFGRLDATDADIEAAAQAAFAHDFIMAFPRGYDTQVGEHGSDLSGGQRQRIAIARALIKDAPIILLDEATAALDSESERQVQGAIARLCEGRTTLVIAHRLSTIMHAACIHVIEDGRVTESGRHDELLRHGGRYASFHRLQLQAQPDALGLAASGG